MKKTLSWNTIILHAVTSAFEFHHIRCLVKFTFHPRSFLKLSKYDSLDEYPFLFQRHSYNKLKKGEILMGYFGNMGNFNCCYGGYGNDYSGGYSMSCGMDYGGKNNSSTFVLIVVLFILLIIVGAAFVQKEY